MPRISVSLKDDEQAALIGLALAEGRDPQAQVRFVLRAELERLGLLPKRDVSKLAQELAPNRKEALRDAL